MATNAMNSEKVADPGIRGIVPWFSRIVMVPPTIIMVLIGFRYITNPLHAASRTGVSLATPEALTDTRVVGALALTLAFAIAISLGSLPRLRIGQLIVIALMGLILAVRFFGFSEDGTTLAMGDQRVKVIGETVFFLLNTAGLFLQSSLQRKQAQIP
jgi:hypothetical protein